MDGVDNEERFSENLKSIQEKLQVVPSVVQFPIGAGKELEGLVDVVEQKAYYFQLGDKKENYQVKEIPANLLAKAKKYQKELLENLGKIIEEDKELALKYLEGQAFQAEEIKKLLRKATLTGEYFPVFCGSAYKQVGVKLILDGVVDYLPSPLDIAKVSAFSQRDENKETLVNCNSPLPYLALAFKIVFDEHNQRITFIRVYAGKISAGTLIYNVNRKEEERVNSLVRIHADNKKKIEEVRAGDIAAVIGLKYTITGDTFSEKKNPLLLENIDFAEPVISQAIEPKTNKDGNKLADCLNKLKIQDPSFRTKQDRETGQMVIEGMGELHLEVLMERLRQEYKVDIERKQRKKTGGSGHDARVWITFEPNEKGKGFKFVDAKKGQDMSSGDAEEVRQGIEEAASSGLLLNYPVVDLKATLTKGERHAVDTKPGDFKQAAIIALRGDGVEEREKRIQDLGVILLEPIMQFEVVVPVDYTGTVTGDLNSRRAIIEEKEATEGNSYIQGKIPLKEMLNYSTILRQLTGGRGEYSMQLSTYQKVSDSA
ncbi:2932_t:CDS:2 [Funneliformis geosporum]|uniref:2932_t:CDS:1 n=1 Tax=Funneliformis geosporum TaxID=1117311 RepID=A0A9W4SB78_9GLOM|nr:2932_t:CDS:2 [Funneliformis geosporum]